MHGAEILAQTCSLMLTGISPKGTVRATKNEIKIIIPHREERQKGAFARNRREGQRGLDTVGYHL